MIGHTPNQEPQIKPKSLPDRFGNLNKTINPNNQRQLKPD
jgi:hypothetical protein